MHLHVRLATGDITEFEGDAIVNAANNHLWMGSGVAGALKRRGGVEIETEAVAQGPIPHGEAVVTAAGSLRARRIIHAAATSAGGEVNVRSLEAATLNALRRADEQGLERVAFPALGGGVAGFPMDQCAAIMLRVLRTFRPRHVKDVLMVLPDAKALAAFEAEARRTFPKREQADLVERPVPAA